MTSAAAEPHWLDDLDRPPAYPHDASAQAGIRRLDTHISHVFLTGERAYKLRRPVRLAFLDFSDPAERLADCRREVALNRRLAPDVYLGLAPILVDGNRTAVVGPTMETPSGDPAVVEHCVVMRRLPAGRDLKGLLERGEAGPAHVDRVAARLAAFHAAHSLGRPAPVPPDEWLATTTAPARANFDALAHAPASLAPPGEIDEARRLAEVFANDRRDEFEARRAAGRVVDGHGDLHCEHVWFERDDSEPLMVDCLEFRDDFRRIDAASDAAFLAMDLAYRGRADLAARFLRRYARDAGDYHLFAVVDYFLSYRALVRAKVASLVAVDEAMPAPQREHAERSVRDHLDLGLSFLQPRGPGRLVLTCGTIGTGKTTVAETIADASGGVVISSDRLRESSPETGRNASDEPPARPQVDAPYGADRYSDAARAAVYDRMLAQAAHVVGSGRTAILDATFSRRAWRAKAAAWARGRGCEAFLVEIVAPKDEVIERLAARASAGNDASEAGPGLYDAMRAEFEEPHEWPEARRGRVDTSAPSWRDDVEVAASRLGLSPTRNGS